VWDPRPSPEPGVRMAFVADLDGNLVELVETGAVGDATGAR
jgi:lactoylglutathione lyase